ncbi:MAG: NFACT family protein [Acholeplasmataceae bacterium]
MAFDGLFLSYLIKELNDSILNHRLEKIVQIDESTFVFSFYYAKNRKFLQLNLSPSNFGLFLRTRNFESKESNQFLLLLKKNLEGSILKGITQYKTDRVAIFTFAGSDLLEGLVEKQLVIELMGRHSNFLLLKENMIVDCYTKMVSEEGRHLIPKAEFEFFPSDQIPFWDFDLKNISTPKDIYKTFMGLSPLVADYLFSNPIKLVDIVVKPTYDFSTGKYYLFDLFPESNQKQTFASLSELLEFVNLPKETTGDKHLLFIEQMLKKTVKKHEALMLDLQKSTNNLEARDMADLIYQSGLSLDAKCSSIVVFGTTITLDVNYTLNENAQQMYEKYKRSKRAVLQIETQIEETRRLLDQLHDLKLYGSLSTSKNDIDDLEQDLIPLGYKTSQVKPKAKVRKAKPNIKQINLDNAIIFIGKNHLQNAYLTHEVALRTDYFFHVKNAPGSHVVLRCSELTEKLLRLSAMFAAYYSSYRHSGSIPVDYTLVKNVRKIPGLPHYQVRYSNYQTIYIDINPQSLAKYTSL